MVGGDNSLASPESGEQESGFSDFSYDGPEAQEARTSTPLADQIEADFNERFGPEPVVIGSHLGLFTGAAARYSDHFLEHDTFELEQGVELVGYNATQGFIEILTKVRDHRNRQKLLENDAPELDLLSEFMDLDESAHPLNGLSNNLLIATLIHYRRIDAPRIHMGRVDTLLDRGLNEAREFFSEGRQIEDKTMIRDLLEIGVITGELMWISSAHPYVESDQHLPEDKFWSALAVEYCDVVHLRRRADFIASNRKNFDLRKWYLWSQQERGYIERQVQHAQQLSGA